ncbi:hypothetical protein [Ornithinimicrobium murale]|uniref:hypothetical protein n=1 Tax=Ornithinimicrobium murale TaxID=1050153 RepID=UPI000E0CC109|nr:hypothetical protein [Ornithinimicrobium murale]
MIRTLTRLARVVVRALTGRRRGEAVTLSDVDERQVQGDNARDVRAKRESQMRESTHQPEQIRYW